MGDQNWPAEAELKKELKEILSRKPPVSARIVANITKLALDHHKWNKQIVFQIERFVTKVSPEHRLAGLYLMDSIVKSATKKMGPAENPYRARFSQNIESTIERCLDCPSKDKDRTIKTIKGWLIDHTFPELVSQRIDKVLSEKGFTNKKSPLMSPPMHPLKGSMSPIAPNSNYSPTPGGAGGGSPLPPSLAEQADEDTRPNLSQPSPGAFPHGNLPPNNPPGFPHGFPGQPNFPPGGFPNPMAQPDFARGNARFGSPVHHTPSHPPPMMRSPLRMEPFNEWNRIPPHQNFPPSQQNFPPSQQNFPPNFSPQNFQGSPNQMLHSDRMNQHNINSGFDQFGRFEGNRRGYDYSEDSEEDNERLEKLKRRREQEEEQRLKEQESQVEALGLGDLDGLLGLINETGLIPEQPAGKGIPRRPA